MPFKSIGTPAGLSRSGHAYDRAIQAIDNFAFLGISGDLHFVIVSGVHFFVNSINRLAKKLRIIILLYLGLVAFRIHFPKTKKTKKPSPYAKPVNQSP